MEVNLDTTAAAAAASPTVTPPTPAPDLALGAAPAPVVPAVPAVPAAPAVPAKIDFAAAKLEMLTSGQLSEATLAMYEGMGITRDDLAILTQPPVNEAQSIQAEVFDAVGGSVAYQELRIWAEANLTAEAQLMFNANISSGRRDLALAAVATLQSEYARMMGTPPSRYLMGASSVPSLGGYASQAEMIADMSEAKYRTDEAFRSQVKRRLALTTAF